MGYEQILFGNQKQIYKHQRSEALEWLPNRKQHKQKPFDTEIDKLTKKILQHNFLQLQK